MQELILHKLGFGTRHAPRPSMCLLDVLKLSVFISIFLYSRNDCDDDGCEEYDDNFNNDDQVDDDDVDHHAADDGEYCLKGWRNNWGRRDGHGECAGEGEGKGEFEGKG